MPKDAEIFASYMSRRGLLGTAVVAGAGVAAAPLLSSPAAAAPSTGPSMSSASGPAGDPSPRRR